LKYNKKLSLSGLTGASFTSLHARYCTGRRTVKRAPWTFFAPAAA
jgi:hypothetical protein